VVTVHQEAKIGILHGDDASKPENTMSIHVCSMSNKLGLDARNLRTLSSECVKSQKRASHMSKSHWHVFFPPAGKGENRVMRLEGVSGGTGGESMHLKGGENVVTGCAKGGGHTNPPGTSYRACPQVIMTMQSKMRTDHAVVGILLKVSVSL
jgi:hypothetical protein